MPLWGAVGLCAACFAGGICLCCGVWRRRRERRVLVLEVMLFVMSAIFALYAAMTATLVGTVR